MVPPVTFLAIFCLETVVSHFWATVCVTRTVANLVFAGDQNGTSSLSVMGGFAHPLSKE